MTEAKRYRIIIGGGGTGGHVFPAISIANVLSRMLDNPAILFVGALGKMEMQKVPEAGYDIVGLPVAGFQRRLSWRNITFFFKLLRSMVISQQLVRRFDPHIAIGVGGYASGPIIKAASRRSVPVVIQEQNSYAGVTNRLLAKTAAKICVAYPGMEKYFPAEKIVITGNPVRDDLILPGGEMQRSYGHFGLLPDKKVILLIGGSLGARTLNESVITNIDTIADSDIQLIWQSGSAYYERALAALEQCGAGNIVLCPFIEEMNRAFQVADVIVSRAGAGTISELCIVGKPVILVPSPNVAEDHQTSNAKALTDRQAGMVVADRDAEKELVATAIALVHDEERKRHLSENIKKFAVTGSSEQIAREIIKLLEKE